MAMSRPKVTDRHLPERMRYRHGAYHHIWYVDGKQRSKKLSTDLVEAMELYYQREGIQPTGDTVGDALTRYQREVLPGKAAATQREYTRYIGRLREVFGDCLLTGVRRRDVAGYLDRRTAKVEGNREIACLSSVFRSAIRWGWCDDNPCLGAPRNHEPRKRQYPTEAQAAALRLAANEQTRCMIDLVELIGIRKKDLIKITLADITERGLRIVAQKTGTVRIYTWTPRLRDVITAARALRRRVGSLYLFARRDGKPYTTAGFDAIWRGACQRAGVTIGIHAFRRVAITRSNQSRGLQYAQAIAGHRSRETTEIYLFEEPVIEVEPRE